MIAPRALRLGLVCLFVAATLVAVPAAAAPRGGGLELSLSRTQVSTGLGDSFTFTSTITNTGSVPLSGLVAHLNVVGFDPSIYVDPEDWSSHRTRYLAPIPAHGATKISWTVTAVNGGNITIFVAVLPRHGAGSIAVSEPLRVDIAKRRTLNSGGVLPLALGIPALLGLSLLGTRVARRGYGV